MRIRDECGKIDSFENDREINEWGWMGCPFSTLELETRLHTNEKLQFKRFLAIAADL